MNKNTFYFRCDQWINRHYGSYVDSYEFTRVAIKDDTQAIEQDLLFTNKDAPDLHFKNMLAFDDYLAIGYDFYQYDGQSVKDLKFTNRVLSNIYDEQLEDTAVGSTQKVLIAYLEHEKTISVFNLDPISNNFKDNASIKDMGEFKLIPLSESDPERVVVATMKQSKYLFNVY